MFYSTEVKLSNKIFELLLVEDSTGDIYLLREALKEISEKINLTVVTDGVDALDYLFKRSPYQQATMPDLILLDLNIPKIKGKEVLKEIKNDLMLKHIPVLVLTISQSEKDILECYNLHANSYFIKPFEINHFLQLLKSIVSYWLHQVTLPQKKE